MKKHVNIPIFIPHLGCPNQCVFCNQRTISGVEKFDISSVKKEIDETLSTVDSSKDAEIAFFGGSFTGIDRELMISLLKLSNEYLRRGAVNSIRCSTRPDYIDDNVLDILEKYGVKTIELGLQTANDSVLTKARRGHTRADEARACDLIVTRGFTLIGQMMIGLPGSTLEDEIETAKFIVEHGAHGARIYPTVVFYGTELCDMARNGEYSPIEIEDAVERSAKALEIFTENGVDVIRIGLCASENLTNNEKYYGGPNHPALGEMVESAVYYNKITACLDNTDHRGAILRVFVARGSLSKAIGQKKNNIHRLVREYGFAEVKIKEDECLLGYEIKIEEERKR